MLTKNVEELSLTVLELCFTVLVELVNRSGEASRIKPLVAYHE